MSLSDNPVVVYHDGPVLRKVSHSQGSSQYSSWVNDNGARSDLLAHYARISHSSSSFEEASTSGVFTVQLNSIKTESIPPEPVARIVSRQTRVHDKDIEHLKPKTNDVPALASDRFSLSYGGDFTLDGSFGPDSLHFLPSDSSVAGDRQEVASSIHSEHWEPQEHQLAPEETPLPPSPSLKGENPSKTPKRPSECNVESAWHEAVAIGKNPSETQEGESRCSSILDLYLGTSRYPSTMSVPSSTTRRVSWSPGVFADEARSQKRTNDSSLGSPTKKLKSWVAQKISRLPTEAKRRNTVDFSYHELSDQRYDTAPPPTSPGMGSTDGYGSPPATELQPWRFRKHCPLLLSPEAVIYEQERYAPESGSAAPTYTALSSGAVLYEHPESQNRGVGQDISSGAHKPSELPHRTTTLSENSQSFRAADKVYELGAMGMPSGDGASTPEHSNHSNYLDHHDRRLTWFSDRNMPPSNPSTRDSSSEEDEPALSQSANNPGGYTRLQGIQDPVARDFAVGDSKVPVQVDSQMPGSYPAESPTQQLNRDHSQKSTRSWASGQAQQGLRSASAPSTRRSSQQPSIEQHKPAQERERYAEPYFAPFPASEAREVDSPTMHREEGSGESASQCPPERMRENVRNNIHPEIQPRMSSSMFRSQSLSLKHRQSYRAASLGATPTGSWEVENGPYIVEFPSDHEAALYLQTLDGEASAYADPDDYERMGTEGSWSGGKVGGLSREGTLVKKSRQDSALRPDAEEKQELREFQRGHRRHHSFRGRIQASLHRASRKGVLARDWSQSKKRYTAIVACASTGLIGLIVGIYAGQVPAIQYVIIDEDTHYAVLGNVFFYTGLAITTVFAWPLPLLYGRKRFTLAGLTVVLALQAPQALVCSQQRDPRASLYRAGLLLPRFVSGLFIGLANMNFWPTLLDVFGSSLQSRNPHQEAVKQEDPRRHGGGMGIWLGIWTWCHIGSIGTGFVIGAVIIGTVNVAWGFWIVTIACLAVMLLSVVTPETRPTAFRKSMAEVRQGAEVSRRVGRGEVMMHLYATGPLHWWEEVRAGFALSFRMLKQSGFVIMALYQGWIYGQVVMIMILLGALASRYYHLRPPYVGLCVAAFPLGALLAVPFQKASIFSRARRSGQRTDSMTFEKRVTWSSHLVRRMIFMFTLPLVAIAYTLTSSGPPLPVALPAIFAGLVGFLTNLALSECYGLIMETFDTSDLQPGMTGRLRKELSEEVLRQRTNFSCYPRVTAGFSIVQTVSFIIAAVATAIGGNVERAKGVQTATGVVAAILVGLTLLLIGAMMRLRTVQVVPTNRVGTAVLSGPGEDLPVVIGSPSGTTRRISLLELGGMTRWTEIRRRNKLLGGGRHGKYP